MAGQGNRARLRRCARIGSTIFPRLSWSAAGSAIQPIALIALIVGFAAGAPAMAMDELLRKTFKPGIAAATDVTNSKPGSADKPVDFTLKPVVFRLEANKTGSISWLEVTSTDKIEASAFVLDNPRRAIIDLKEVLFELEPSGFEKRAGAGRGAKSPKSARRKISAGLIASFRFGVLAKGKSRIVVSLAGPAKIARITAIQVASTVHRLRIDFAASDLTEFRQEAAAGLRKAAARAPASGPPAVKKAGAGTGLPVIVIDPGHGGIDGGARGVAEVPEKDIVYAFAKALEKQLNATKRYKVILTRDSDVFVPLGQRVELARMHNAKLFLSIHADALNEKSVQGATVYTVSDRASDAHAARLAEKENNADAAAGYESPKVQAQISDILFDLTRRETRAFSHVFANSLIIHWRKSAKLNKNPHRSAGFRVLQAPDVPSVLLELGYVSSHSDARLLTRPDWQRKTAASIAASIDAFFTSQMRKQPALALPSKADGKPQVAVRGKLKE